MGYYTRYELEVVEGSEELIGKFREECESAQYAFDDYGDGEEETKWYDHDDDLSAFSKKHPDALFKLTGEGEESGDMWAEYHKNGKCQRCQAIVTFEEYDENKLK